MSKGVTLSFKADSLRRLKKEIINGINIGSERYVKKLKNNLKNGQQPAVWDNDGNMQNILEFTGLSKYTYAGRLKNAWDQTIDNIKVDRRYNNVVMNLFNSRILDEQTVWIGLQKRPKDYIPMTKSKKSNTTTEDPSNIHASVIYNGGYRPIGRGTGKGWTWELNPYPDSGYWLLYEQGWGQYAPKNFIKNSFANAFGPSSANVLGQNGEVIFNSEEIKIMNNMIVDEINSKGW